MLLVNSWGTGWGAYLPEAGEAGFIWIGYDYFRTRTGGTTNYMTDRINYQPTLVGSFGIKHERRGELSVRLLAGDLDNPDWEMDVLPIGGGPVPINTTIGFDATDYATNDEMNFWLTVQDYDIPSLWSPSKTGTVTSFEVKLANGHVWQSPDTPVDTVDLDTSNLADTIARLNISLLYKDANFLPDGHGFDTSHVWADLDGDGDFDLLFFDTPWDFTDAKCRIFRKEGAGAMQERSCSIPYFSQGDLAVADVNSDGLVDVAINGYLNNQPTTKIYFNTGNFLFVDSGIQLPGSYGPMAWIDYNNDGRPDLSLMPTPSAYMRPVQVLLQNTNGGFSPANLGLPATRNFAWADYNRDGRLDVALPISSGYALYYQNSNGQLQAGPVLGSFGEVLAWGDADNDGWLDLALTTGNTEIWRNNHDGSFSLYASITSAAAGVGGMSWGDLNNDGLSDLAIWGDFGNVQGMYYNISPRILLNHGNGNFTFGGFNFIGVTGLANSTADLLQWIDYDNDGDLDISLAGIGPLPDLPRRFALYINHAADANGLGTANTPPTAPALLEATQSQADGPVQLSWSSGNDVQTSPAGLFYNVRIGRNPTTSDILAPDAVTHLGAAMLHPTLNGSTLGLALESPPSPAFYWSVQSVDGGHARSPWSPPQLFSATPGLIPGDLNNDSVIDVADVLKTARMANGSEPVNTATADRNGDNKVDQKDVFLMESTVLGESGGGSDIITSTSIGPAGGTLIADGFTLEVPAGAFSEPVKLTLYSTDFDKPFGASGRSPLFRLKGLPAARNKPLTLRILSNAPVSDKAYVALGQYASAFDAPVIERRFSAIPASDSGNGEYEIHIPAADESAASLSAAASKKPFMEEAETLDSQLDDMRDALVDADVILVVGYFNNAYQSTHFNIMESGVTLKYADAIHLAESFEHAYNVLTSAPYSFKCKFNSSGKVDVYVKKMASGTYGLEQSSALGKLNNYIDVNFDKLADKTAIEQTAVHEFFHYIQDLYDPQSMRNKYYLGSRYLWLEEASSVWSEELAINNDIPANVFMTHVWDSLGNGLHAGTLGIRKNRQYAGYGSAGLIKYISMLPNGARRIRNIFEDIALNKHSVTAVLDYMQPIDQHWINYLKKIFTGKLYTFSDIPIKLDSITKNYLLPNADAFRKARDFDLVLPDLGGASARMVFGHTSGAALTDRHALSFKLNIDEQHPDVLQMFVIKRRDTDTGPMEGEVLGEAIKANNSLKFDVPDIKALRDEGWEVLAVLANRRAIEPYDGKITTRLTMAVTSDEQIDLKAMDVPGHQAYGGIPMMHATGSVKAGGWTDYEMKDFLPYDPGTVLPFLRLKIPGVTPLPMELTYQATITNGLKIGPPDANGYYTVWSVGELQGYELAISTYERGQTEPTPYMTLSSTDGHFLFDIPGDTTAMLSGLMEVSYTVGEQRYDKNDDPVGNPSSHHSTSAILFFFMEL
jgi:hypothetical protein